MKIELEVSDIKTVATAMNNAIIAYGKIIRAIMLGCEIPKDFEPLQSLDDYALLERYRCMQNMYEQIEAIEKQCLNGYCIEDNEYV